LAEEDAMYSTHDEVERDVVVTARANEAEGVVVLTLELPDGGDLPVWTPGAHTDLLMGDGLVRQYSLCGDPADRRRWQVAVLLEPRSRGGSRFVHAELAEGATLRVRGPRNHFALAPAKSYLFVAGGIGITPILPMVAAAEAEGAQWRLAYGGRTRASMAFRTELTQRYGERVDIRPQDETGLLDLAGLLGSADSETLVYCCGPEPLLAAVEAACGHWPFGALHVERFSPKKIAEPVRQESFEVELAKSGMVLTVLPGRSVLEVVEEAGVTVLSSCTQGTCGTCETTVLAGVPEHHDSLLSADERAANDTMFICVSRSCSQRLVLEL
jgi:ferredoxin-NADP reductase